MAQEQDVAGGSVPRLFITGSAGELGRIVVAELLKRVPADRVMAGVRSSDHVVASQGSIQNWWRQGMMGSAKAHYDGIKAFSETDQTGDLKAISVPTLVLHGEDDQIVLPIDNSARLSVKLLRNGTLKTYPEFSHGMLTVNADVLNADLLTFVKG